MYVIKHMPACLFKYRIAQRMHECVNKCEDHNLYNIMPLVNSKVAPKDMAVIL